jgi:hypothetical protein
MKKTLILGVFLLPILLLAGCGTNPKIAANPQGGRDFRQPDFGQPQKPADVTGVVESITGNEVTILKIERPQGGNPDATSTEKASGGTTTNRASSPAAIGSTDRGGFGMRGPGGAGGPDGQGRQQRQETADEQAAMLEKIKSMSTGKEVVIIPVGIQMLKSDDSGGAPGMIEATLKDVKQNKMVQIWLDDAAAERKIANFVMIMK